MADYSEVGPPEDQWQDLTVPSPHVDEHWEDVSPPDTKPPEQSLLSRGWHAISDPLTDAPSRFAKTVGDYVDQPVNRDDTYLSGVMARAKGFGAGALQGIGDLASGLTSPINLATTALTMGEAPLMKAGYSGLANAANLGAKAAGALTGIHGAGQVLSPDSTLSERGFGLAEMAGGAAGMFHGAAMKPGLANIGEEVKKPSAITSEDLKPSTKPSKSVAARPEEEPTSGFKVLRDEQGNITGLQKAAAITEKPQVLTGDVVSEGAPPIRTPTGNFWVDDANRMKDQALSERMDPRIQGPRDKANQEWNRRARENSINEGRFNEPNSAPIPDEQLTPEQLAIKQSYENIRAHQDKYSQWFSEEENKLPEDQYFKAPPEIEDQHVMEQEQLKDAHKRLVDAYMQENGPASGAGMSSKPGYQPIQHEAPTPVEQPALAGGPPAGLPPGNQPPTGGEPPIGPEPPKKGPIGSGKKPPDYSVPAGMVDPFQGYRKAPVGTKYEISPDKMNLTKMKNAIKLGFDIKLEDNGKISLTKTKESPTMKQMADPRIEDSALMQAANLPRTLLASMDLSAPLRQGLGLIHKKAFWTAIPKMLEAFKSEDAYRRTMDSITEDPMFQKTIGADGKIQKSFAEKAGLKLTDLNNMSGREENFMSAMAEKVPGVRASERAYTVFLNKLRADTFKSMVGDFGTFSGINMKNNIKVSADIANFVNNASGRGNLGALEGSAKALSTVLFSPRLMASRIGMMAEGARAVFSPQTYIMSQPSVRREYLKSLFAIAAAGNSVTQLLRMAGGTVETDPASSDFGKAKIGNTRIDPYGGFQQMIVAAQRLMPNLGAVGLPDIGGQMKSTTNQHEYSLDSSKFGQSTRADVLSRFVRGKTNPIINFGWGLLAGQKELSGKPMQFATANPFENSVSQRFIPMLLQDVYDLATVENDAPIPAKIGAGVLAGLGMGTQTYESK